MIVLDSNLWIALYSENDSQHTAAILAFSAIHEPILVPHFIIAEVCTILTRDDGKNVALAFLNRVENTAGIEMLAITAEEFTNIIEFYQQSYHSGLSFVDIFLLWLAQQYRVFTLDKKLERAIARQKKM